MKRLKKPRNAKLSTLIVGSTKGTCILCVLNMLLMKITLLMEHFSVFPLLLPTISVTILLDSDKKKKYLK